MADENPGGNGEMVGYSNNWAGVRLASHHTHWTIQRQTVPADGHVQSPNYFAGIWEDEGTAYDTRAEAEAAITAQLGPYQPPED